MNRKTIYLDHAATTQPEEEVILAMAQAMRDAPYNASAAYGAAGAARRIHRLCRAQLASMLACDPQEIFFTSGGTESNNWAVQSFSGSHMIVSAIEHHCVIEAARACASSVTLVSPDETGYVAPESIAAAIRPDTRLICLQAANNETGVIQPVREVHAIAKAHGIHLHVDAVAAIGHIPLNASCCDSMSLCAHKLYGPRGIGALYIRGGSTIKPLLHGGAQEGGMRAGTENTPAIRGFHVAAKLAAQDMAARAEREQNLLDAFANRLNTSGVARLGESRARLPGVCALLLHGVSAEQAIAALDLKGILISGGAACASQSGTPSHVYTAMGLSPEEASNVIRVSIGRHTTQEELDLAAQEIEALLCTLTPAPAHQNTSQ